MLVEPGILERLPALAAQYLPARRTALVTDDTVGELYGRYLAGANPAWQGRGRTCSDGAPAGWRERFTVPPGEQSKTREAWASLTDRLLAAGHGRGSGIVAMGGGVVTDLAGFVAATLGRGIPTLLVPTTLLGMVDAAIGGKTGVNTPAGKNLVGAFHLPAAVIADPLTLATLPDAVFADGIAESLKHGLIADASHLDWIVGHAAAIQGRDAVLLTGLIERSVAIKSAIVADDPRDGGRRALLNAGHTVAHAIEHVSHYAIPHGRAVGLGLLAEAVLARRLGRAGEQLEAAVRGALRAFALPETVPSPLPADALVSAMRGDKKATPGQVRFALLAEPGRPAGSAGCWTHAAPEAEIVASLRAIGAG